MADLRVLASKGQSDPARTGIKRPQPASLTSKISRKNAVMHHFSKHIDTIAAALARAQAELINPEAMMKATAQLSPMPAGHASPAASFDIIRTTLGRQEIAIIQATRIEQVTGRIYLSTILAHVSGEWLSSDLPVCTDIDTPQRLEQAFSHARRHALLTLVGFATEHEAVNVSTVPAKSQTSSDFKNAQDSNNLQEATKQRSRKRPPTHEKDSSLAFPKEPSRRRSKAHLAFIRGQGCLVCQRSPVDAHHLKFAQPSMLGRKVSDEFTVPLCRSHHQALHRHGNERAWWTNLQLKPLQVAKELWATSPAHSDVCGKSSFNETITIAEARQQ